MAFFCDELKTIGFKRKIARINHNQISFNDLLSIYDLGNALSPPRKYESTDTRFVDG